ncbi:MAG: SpoIIE family protein phosphatase [Bacteroidales bacterium]
MKRVFLFLLIVTLSASVFAQINKFGVPVIVNISTQVTPGGEQNWCVTKDKFGIIYLANDDKGVLSYNGTSWTNIPVRSNARPRALGCDNFGIVYVGCENEFGYIEPDASGKQVYVSLSGKFDLTEKNDSSKDSAKTEGGTYIGRIFSLLVTDSTVYYLSDEALFIYNISKRDVEYINLRKQGFTNLTRIFSFGDKLILGDNVRGLFEFKSGKLAQLPGGEFFSGKICLALLPVTENEVLIGTYNKGIYKYNISDGTVNDKWVDESVSRTISQVYCGSKLSSGEYIFGTVNGDGAFVFDANGKLTGHWTSTSSGLPDNTVYALYADQNNNELWILTYGFISKAYVNLPFTHFSKFNGIDQPVNGICEIDGVIYISTDKGVFRSFTDKDKIRRFEQIEGIDDQVFPIIKAEVDNEKFVLAGSLLVINKISTAGRSDTVRINNLFPKLKDNYSVSARSILQSTVDPHLFYIGTDADGLLIIEYRNRHWNKVKENKDVSGTLSSLAECSNGDFFVLTDSPNALYKVDHKGYVPTKVGEGSGLPEGLKTNLGKIDSNIVLSTFKGFYRYVETTGKWEPFDQVTNGYSEGKEVDIFVQDEDRDMWVEFSHGRFSTLFFPRTGTIETAGSPLNLLPNLKALDMEGHEGKLWMAISKNLYVLDKEALKRPVSVPQTLFTRIKVGRDSLIMNGTFVSAGIDGRRLPSTTYVGSRLPQLKYSLNSVSFYWTTPYYIEEEHLLYSYKLEGFNNEWSKWENIIYKDFTNLPFGKYTFRIKALTPTGVESKEAVYEFSILKPWYFTTVMIILYFIVFIVLIILIIMAYTRKLKNENIRLEGIVAERTAVVVKQKEELESSIHYASRIQMALLPSESILSENLRNYFILFKPRDIVSGDFYWMTKKDNRLYIVAADCTGHGVPGAFMSLLGMSFLDEIIGKEGHPRADQVLSELRLHVTDSLKQSGGDDEAKDGMDMALLVIDFNDSKIEFSGAYNPCFRVRRMTAEETATYHDDNMEMTDGSMSNGKYLLETIYASKMPIGISSRMDEKFVFHEWSLEKGVSYYMFSDGYIDQFGGDHGRKFMKKNFKRLILDIQDYPMSRQKELLDQNLKEWMGHSPQIDDILVMGLRTE